MNKVWMAFYAICECQGFVQGSVGAAIGGSCAHPLDLIKVGDM